MGTIQLTKHFNEMETFLSVSDHLKLVLKNFEDMGTVDKNDLYDLIYNKRKIENWLTEDIANENVRDSLKSLLTAINTITNSLSKSQIDDIMLHHNKSIQKLNETKYGNKNEYKGLRDKKALREKRRSIMSEYFKKRIVGLIVIGAILMIMFSGGITEVTEVVADKVAETTVKALDTTAIENTHTENNLNIQNEEIKGSTDALSDSLNGLKSILGTFIGIILMMICTFLMIKSCIEILYLSMPAIRMMLDQSKFISDDAKQIVEIDYQMEIYGTEATLVDYKNRLETAVALLHNLEDYIEKATDFIANYDIYQNENNHIQVSSDIKEKVKYLHKQAESKNTLIKLSALADAEIMYRALGLNEVKDSDVVATATV